MRINTLDLLLKEIKEIQENEMLTNKEKDLYIGSAKKELYRTNRNEYSKYEAQIN